METEAGLHDEVANRRPFSLEESIQVLRVFLDRHVQTATPMDVVLPSKYNFVPWTSEFPEILDELHRSAKAVHQHVQSKLVPIIQSWLQGILSLSLSLSLARARVCVCVCVCTQDSKLFHCIPSQPLKWLTTSEQCLLGSHFLTRVICNLFNFPIATILFHSL